MILIQINKYCKIIVIVELREMYSLTKEYLY
jgi:hypothetical protein